MAGGGCRRAQGQRPQFDGDGRFQNVLLGTLTLRFGRVDDGVMRFGGESGQSLA